MPLGISLSFEYSQTQAISSFLRHTAFWHVQRARSVSADPDPCPCPPPPRPQVLGEGAFGIVDLVRVSTAGAHQLLCVRKKLLKVSEAGGAGPRGGAVY